MKRKILFLAAVLLSSLGFATTIIVPANGRVYVIQNATGDGSGWRNASGSLADVLSQAASNGTTEIWVASGTYKPEYRAGNGTTDRDKSFVLVKNVKIYGGFAGTENSISERKIAENITILSGDLDDNDTTEKSTLSDNCYHVIISAEDVGTALLDGFTITGGNADGSDTFTVNGKGIYREFGGGLYNMTSSPTVTNCNFVNNIAYRGGGIYNTSSTSTITNCSFSNNSAVDGGGIYNTSSSPTIMNCTFANNTASAAGGGIRNTGSTTKPVFSNSIIYNNTNTAGTIDNVINTSNAVPTYRYSLVQGCSGSSNWNTNFGAKTQDKGNNIDDDPMFVDVANTNLQLKKGSPCIDSGLNSANRTPTDLAGNVRIYNTAIDMGAYEYQGSNSLYIEADEIKTKSDYILGRYEDIIIKSNDTSTGQLTIPAGESLTVNGVIKFEKTITSAQCYSLGFPFDIQTIYSELYNGDALVSYLQGYGGDFWMKGYDEVEREFYFKDFGDENSTDRWVAGEGCVLQFPSVFNNKVVTFVSENNPVLKSATDFASIEETGRYCLKANPSVSNISLTDGVSNIHYYPFNGTKTFLHVAEGTFLLLKPFESLVLINVTDKTNIVLKSISMENVATDSPNVKIEEDEIIDTHYYNLQGIEIKEPVDNGVYIEKKIYKFQKVKIKKVLYNNQ